MPLEEAEKDARDGKARLLYQPPPTEPGTGSGEARHPRLGLDLGEIALIAPRTMRGRIRGVSTGKYGRRRGASRDSRRAASVEVETAREAESASCAGGLQIHDAAGMGPNFQLQ